MHYKYTILTYNTLIAIVFSDYNAASDTIVDFYLFYDGAVDMPI